MSACQAGEVEVVAVPLHGVFPQQGFPVGSRQVWFATLQREHVDAEATHRASVNRDESDRGQLAVYIADPTRVLHSVQIQQRIARRRLTRTELASGLAKRPYDLRHAGISFWLYSGVDPAECARRVGQSIEVLFRHCAKFLDGVREQANRLIEQSMKEWDRVSQGPTPAG
ncbi:hypothetical protein [Streptomyces sirii]|uniref:hypothetical protein n=1 Tax=Streptomyces sirii TaxID=3127701 RepID=UPI003D36FFFC